MSTSTSTIENRAPAGRDLTRLPDEVRARLSEASVDLVEAGITVRQAGNLLEARRRPIELRLDEAGDPVLDGYATVYEHAYDVAGGVLAGGWVETFAAGACRKSVAERDDVSFLYNHDGLVMASIRARTLLLESDENGLRVEAHPNPRMTFASDVVSMIERGDVDEMSLAFRAIRQEWNADYTERRILEARIYDVSAVEAGANPATVIQARAELELDREEGRAEGRISTVLARAIADAARSRAPIH